MIINSILTLMTKFQSNLMIIKIFFLHRSYNLMINLDRIFTIESDNYLPFYRSMKLSPFYRNMKLSPLNKRIKLSPLSRRVKLSPLNRRMKLSPLNRTMLLEIRIFYQVYEVKDQDFFLLCHSMFLTYCKPFPRFNMFIDIIMYKARI